MQPYYQDKYVQIFHGDCREILPELSGGGIDLVLTDPPYGVNKTEWDIETDWRILLPQVMRILPVKDDSIVIVFCATRYIADTIGFIPFPYRWQFIASCPNNMIPGDIGFAKYTSALIFSSRKSIHSDAQDLREFAAGTDELKHNGHPTPKPISIIAYLVEHFSKPDELILDPFLGSGTTAYCAKKLGRKCIGIEISEKYCEIAARRCQQAVMELDIPQQPIEKQRTLDL